MISSSLINILMFSVRMQIDRLMCSIYLEMFLILKKEKFYIILSFHQILIIVQLSSKFCNKVSICKIEKTQERALQFVLNDKKSSYSSLLEKSKQTTLHLKCIKRIAFEVYKSLNKLNPLFMTDMFEERNIYYDLRDNSVLTQPI